MSFLRWTPTLLGFPIGGWLAVQIAGPATDPLAAALAGAIAGAVIGGAQWLALGRRASWLWILATTFGMAAGTAVSVTVTGGATSVLALAVTGVVTGAIVGTAQALTLRLGWRVVAAWASTVSLSWAAGWIVTANVIVDAERGYVTFGLSGTVPVTIATGLVLAWIFRSAAKRRAAVTVGAVAPAAQVPAVQIPAEIGIER
jgi:hypothetical protein